MYTNDETSKTTEECVLNEQATASREIEEGCQDRLLRVTADFQNYRRRMEKERASWFVDGQVHAIRVFLPVVDEIERALESEQKAQGSASCIAGLAMILKNAQKRLVDLGVVEVDCTKEFNPQFHEVVMEVASEATSGSIVAVLQRGYMLGNVVILHAKVSIAK